MINDWFQTWGNCVKDIGDAKNVATLDCIPKIFLNLVGALIAFAGLTALIMGIIGSFKFMNAEGDPKKIEGAQNIFIFGLIGLSIVVFSFLIIQIIAYVTDVQCITKFGFGCN